MNNFEDLLIQSQRWKRVFGEIFLCIDWDPAKGDKKPKGEGRIGDVTFSLREPSRFLLEPRRIYSEIRDCIEIHDIIHVEEARKRFNDKTIMPDNSKKIYDYNGSPEEKREEEVVVYRYIYKPDEFLPEGLVRFIVGEKVVDEAEKYPFSHADFPWERLTDIDAPTRVRGISSYQYLKPIQHQYNKITSLISRNIFMVAHPKIMMPEGAAKVESMGNSMTAVTFRGPTPPAVVNFQPNPPEAYAYRERMLTEMQQISGEHGISRGQPPPGVRAGIALQFLEEQERKGRNTHIVKHNDFILRVAKKAIGVFADYAKPDDERMIRILGKNNQYSIYSLQGAKLSGPYDIQIQNATAFSESYAGRISQIIELQQNIPGLLSREQIADVLEFGQAEKFYDIATASTRSAEAENEEMLQDRDVKDPEVWENLIVHWKTHMTAIQSRYFKENVPPSVQQRFFMHILATETLLEEQAAKSPALLQQVLALPEFPAFLELEPPPQPVIDPNTGAPVGAGQGMSPQEIPPGEPAGTEELSPQGEIPPEGPPIQ